VKFLLLADVHAQNMGFSRASKERMLYVKQLFEDLKELSILHKPNAIILAGDLWTPKYDINRLLFKELYDILENFNNFIAKFNIKLFLLLGNHEYPCAFLLNMFKQSHIMPILKQKKIAGPDFDLFLQPYNKHIAEDISNIVLSKDKNYLISHCPVLEGRPSMDTKIFTDLSIKDLQHEKFDYVILGDFHTHQKIDSNVYYLGSPFPLDFGATNLLPCVFMLDTETNEFIKHKLPSVYPKFRQVKIEKIFKELLDYNPKDYYRIFCPFEMVQQYKLLYPDAEIVPLHNKDELNTKVATLKQISFSDRIKDYVDLTTTELDKNILIGMGNRLVKESI